MTDNYDKKLADWMQKQGVGREVIAGSVEHADAEEIALRLVDKKLKGEDYCVLCGHGPQPISGMELITRRDDPYIQPEDDSDEDEDDRLPEVSSRVRACPKCWAKNYGPGAVDGTDDEDDEAGICQECGGDGTLEYNDAGPSYWGEDCPSEVNHLVTCRSCKGTGRI